jgi:23S rRNA pseudouridine1911/1915/1917 synthase
MRWKLEQILKKGGGGILLEDDSIIIINKPAHLLVLPDRYDKSLHSLYELLKDTFGSIFVVHRIDRETSGIVIFAKTAEVHSNLNDAFEHRLVEKAYRAIVAGTPHAENGEIDLPLSESEYGVRKMSIDEKHGKESFTEYKLLENFDGYALVEARPRTGRTHQIRIHLSAIGLPILADPLYGNDNGFYLSSIKRNYKTNGEEQPLLSRTALHAYSLSITHPATGEKVTVEAPMPKDFEAVLKALRKYKGRKTN